MVEDADVQLFPVTEATVVTTGYRNVNSGEAVNCCSLVDFDNCHGLE